MDTFGRGAINPHYHCFNLLSNYTFDNPLPITTFLIIAGQSCHPRDFRGSEHTFRRQTRVGGRGAYFKKLQFGIMFISFGIELLWYEVLELSCYEVLELSCYDVKLWHWPPHSTLSLTESGDIEVIKPHENFRLFACMNPPTDVGKRDLPPGGSWGTDVKGNMMVEMWVTI